ncbi:redoxin domain-containing protein [Luteolibacter yonseiensis]|uniref:Redoxin domain-containing protein n=1 Tax=Luteolibacter yonseiensis TaxID=1144680 RepID=A0A934R128_9BACT|nr:redoxin domain-containing protein [Luteolibacter yonseiensis]MBK1814799.1 redoxin domain-containing protein [Luteolibacter yonseiensis]
MKSIILTTLVSACAFVTAHAAEIGKPAPAFTAKDAKGATVSLADQKGKVVVLEWVNFDCPFVKKHYGSGNLQKLQADYTAKGVVWLTISSAAEGKDAYVEPSKLGELASSKGSKASHIIADGDGKIGKAYDAKVTPHLFIIDKEGKLAYNGAIDSKATTEVADVDTADKLFANAADAVLAGKTVENAKNQPYGCGVKY